MRAPFHRRSLSGEIDIASKDALALAFDEIPDCETLVVDLRETTYIDSSGLSALVALRRRLRAQCGGNVRILVGNSHVYRLLTICGLEKIFDIQVGPSADQTGASPVTDGLQS